MRYSDVPATCTARHFHGFLGDMAPNHQFDQQSKTIKNALDMAKNHRIVNVFAFLIEGSQKKSAEQLESFGFKRVADYHDYKYPTTSKRLWLYSRDMNDWTIGEQKTANVNPFAPATAQQAVFPEPQAARQPWVNPPPVRIAPTRAGTLAYPIRLERGVLRRQTRETWRNPLPLNRWVDVPEGFLACPDHLRMAEIAIQRRDGVTIPPQRGDRWGWDMPPNTPLRIIRVMRVA